MDFYQIKARAKINWALNVIAKRKDGYHDLQNVMQNIELYDTVTLRRHAHRVPRLECSRHVTCAPEENLAYRAAQVFTRAAMLRNSVSIQLQKYIPAAAGLGGGSSDAAAVLQGMNTMYGEPFTQDELMRLGLKLGADVPFLIMGGAAYAGGVGEKLTPIATNNVYHIVLCKPDTLISTREVFENLKFSEIGRRPNIQATADGLFHNDFDMLVKGIGNVLECVTTKMCGEVDSIKEELLALGASAAAMTGSGPTVFGIFRSRSRALRATQMMRHRYAWCVCTQSCAQTMLEQLQPETQEEII